jgi:CRP/FNR family transcriptional regulator
VCLFTGKRFAAALNANPAQERILHVKALDDLDGARAQLLVLGRMKSMERVASLFIKLEHMIEYSVHSRKGSTSNYPVILLPMTRMDMADYLGLTIETVSRCLTKFKLAGLIRLRDPRTIELCDPDGIRAIAECRGTLCN